MCVYEQRRRKSKGKGMVARRSAIPALVHDSKKSDYEFWVALLLQQRECSQSEDSEFESRAGLKRDSITHNVPLAQG